MIRAVRDFKPGGAGCPQKEIPMKTVSLAIAVSLLGAAMPALAADGTPGRDVAGHLVQRGR